MWAFVLSAFIVLTAMPAVFAREQAYAEAAKGTPVIDAAIDDIWNTTEEITTVHWAEGEGGSTGRARMLWDEQYLYILAIVNEVTLDDTNVNAWEQDCVEIYIDENNGKTTAYEPDDAYYRIGFTTSKAEWIM